MIARLIFITVVLLAGADDDDDDDDERYFDIAVIEPVKHAKKALKYIEDLRDEHKKGRSATSTKAAYTPTSTSTPKSTSTSTPKSTSTSTPAAAAAAASYTPASTSTPKSTSTSTPKSTSTSTPKSTSASTPAAAAAAALSREKQAKPDMNIIVIPAIAGVSLLLCAGFIAARGRTKQAGALVLPSASSSAVMPSNDNKFQPTKKSSRTMRSARLKRKISSLTSTFLSRSLANRSVGSMGSSGSMMSQNSSRKLDRPSISSMNKSRRAQRNEDKSRRNKRGG